MLFRHTRRPKSGDGVSSADRVAVAWKGKLRSEEWRAGRHSEQKLMRLRYESATGSAATAGALELWPRRSRPRPNLRAVSRADGKKETSTAGRRGSRP